MLANSASVKGNPPRREAKMGALLGKLSSYHQPGGTRDHNRVLTGKNPVRSLSGNVLIFCCVLLMRSTGLERRSNLSLFSESSSLFISLHFRLEAPRRAGLLLSCSLNCPQHQLRAWHRAGLGAWLLACWDRGRPRDDSSRAIVRST